MSVAGEVDWPLTISAGIEVNLGFGPTNALNTDNPCCCKELSLVSPGDSSECWAVFEHVSYGTLCFDMEEKALTSLYYLYCHGVYLCKLKHQLHITTWKHTMCPRTHPDSQQHEWVEPASK